MVYGIIEMIIARAKAFLQKTLTLTNKAQNNKIFIICALNLAKEEEMEKNI